MRGACGERAAGVLGVDRYRSRRGCDAAVRLRIRELARKRRRFAYRRLHQLIREGCRMNQKRFRRLYRGRSCRCPGAAGAGHAGTTRATPRPNERWSLDFVSDCLTDGRRFRILAIVDDFTRESLALIRTRRCRGCGCHATR